MHLTSRIINKVALLLIAEINKLHVIYGRHCNSKNNGYQQYLNTHGVETTRIIYAKYFVEFFDLVKRVEVEQFKESISFRIYCCACE